MPLPSSTRPGRRPDPALADRCRQRLLHFERSGLSAVAFCAKEGVSPPSFYAWRQRLRQPPVEQDARTSMLAAELARLLPAAPAEVLLPSGRPVAGLAA